MKWGLNKKLFPTEKIGGKQFLNTNFAAEGADLPLTLDRTSVKTADPQCTERVKAKRDLLAGRRCASLYCYHVLSTLSFL